MCGEKKMGKKWERRNKGSNWQWKENKFRKTTTASQFQTDQKKVMYGNSRKWMEVKRAWKRTKIFFFFSAGFCSLEYVVFFSIGLNDLTPPFFFILFLLLCVMTPRWADPVEMEVKSNRETTATVPACTTATDCRVRRG